MRLIIYVTSDAVCFPTCGGHGLIVDGGHGYSLHPVKVSPKKSKTRSRVLRDEIIKYCQKKGLSHVRISGSAGLKKTVFPVHLLIIGVFL